MKAFDLWTQQHQNAFMALSVLLCGVLGGGFYLLLARLGGLAPQLDILLCCIFYPGTVLGFWGSVLWLFRHNKDE